jgi:predicted alpha/beta hydrolase family esterase
MLQDTYDRQKIAQYAGKIVLINADNDPRGCTDTQARPVAKKLGATFVLAEGMGHMGS